MPQFGKRKVTGATLTGYGLIVGLIAITALLAITQIGSGVDSMFDDVAGELGSVIETADSSAAPGTDADPDSFDFADLTGQLNSSQVSSDIVQITGIDTAASVSVSGQGSPEFRICADSGCSSVEHSFGTGAQTIDAGEYLQLRLTSSASDSTTVTASVSVGGGGANWAVTTGQQVLFSQSFTAGGTSPQCSAWEAWVVANINTSTTYNSITLRGSGDPVGRTCTGSDANDLCQAIRAGTQITRTCDGFEWQTFVCNGSYGSVQAETPGVQSVCQCPNSSEGPFYVMRPCHTNYGGINDANSCSSVNQTFELICGY